jgi:hypothetical protein
VQFIDNLFFILFYRIFKRKTIVIKERYKIDFISTILEINNNKLLIWLYNLLPNPDISFKVNTEANSIYIRRGKKLPLSFYEDKNEIYKKIVKNRV